MLDLYLIRQNPEFVKDALKKKDFDADFSALLEWDSRRRSLINEIESLKSKRNKVSASVPAVKKAGGDVAAIFAEMKKIGEDIAAGDREIDALSTKINDFLLRLPNMPDADLTPGGKENNAVVKVFGQKPEHSFKIKNHVEICTAMGLIDYERGVKLSGSGFWVYRGLGARLEWALLNYFIAEHLADGYEFILPPHQLGYNCGLGAGQFPKFADEVYWIEGEADKTKNRFMLPTAETALVNLFAGEILEEDKLPVKLFAYTPCFRKEAGSYGSEERGMIRGHQFNKVEMVQIASPKNSAAAFAELVEKAARLVEKLGLHFRVSKLAAGDCSASMARTYDIEVWIPSMGIFKEVSSVSNANDFQARRNNTRYRDLATGKTAFVHTLNGSGLATSRLIPAIVEQFQTEDSGFIIPEVLKKYMP